jgi:hypothetical protein
MMETLRKSSPSRPTSETKEFERDISHISLAHDVKFSPLLYLQHQSSNLKRFYDFLATLIDRVMGFIHH